MGGNGLFSKKVIRGLCVCAYPLLNILLQSSSNPYHFFYLAMGDSTAGVVTAYVSFLAERVERANKPRIFSHGQFQRLNNPIVMTVPRIQIFPMWA
jgi:hypothetical protein